MGQQQIIPKEDQREDEQDTKHSKKSPIKK